MNSVPIVGWVWNTLAASSICNPPAASILRADILPPYGGDTAWTNLVAAYANLPGELRDFVDRLDIKDQFHTRAAAGSQRERKVQEAPLVAYHPAVRVHPVTGERALFVSPRLHPGAARDPRVLAGAERAHPQAALGRGPRTEYTVRFRWAPGSVAFWDNRATAHLAIADAGHRTRPGPIPRHARRRHPQGR